MKNLKKTLVLIVTLLVLIIIGGSIYMFSYALKTQVKPTDKEDSYAYLFEHDYLKTWIDSLNQRSAIVDTFITANDGSKLHGLYIKSDQKSSNTALIVHGYTDNAIRMLMIGHLYNKELGYNVLLPDLRGQGESKNDYIQMGWKDRLDIIQWIDVARTLFGDSTNIVMHGISMGAAAIMMTSGEDLPNNVKCFVEDCGYTSVWDEFKHELKTSFGLPPFPFLYTASLYCQIKQGWNFKEASSINQIKKTERPMFFIHGDSDTYVPTWMVYKLYEAKLGDKELWVAPGSTHAKAYWDHTEEYVKKTADFVNKYMK